MQFIWPLSLVLLLLVPLAVWWYLRRQERRRALVARYGSLGLLKGPLGQNLGIRRHIPPILFLLAMIILIVGLARPQAVLSLPQYEGTVILAFDVSGSMAADDLKPTRMAAAQAAARDFIAKQPRTVQIGIVAFSDNGFSGQVPTNDDGALQAAINRLAPQRGTSLANGITASLKLLEIGNGQVTHYYSNLPQTPTPTPTPVPQGTYTGGVIVLLTDGENNENPDPLEAAKAASGKGVRIYTVGIGSPAGTTVKINGFSIHTALDEETLKQIAQTTGGTYFNASTDKDLEQIYSNLNAQLVMKTQKLEMTSIFAGVSVFVMLIGGCFSLLWFSRLP